MRFLSFLLLAFLAFTAGTVTTSAQKPKGKKVEKKEEKKDPTTVTEVGGKALEEWVKEISSTDRSKGVTAMKTVLLFGPERARAAIPVILKELKKHKPGIASVDTGFVINAPTALTMILSNLNREKLDPKEAKVFTEELKDTIKILKALLHDKQVVISHRAAQALALFGPLARETLPELILALKTPSFETRQAAVVALSTVGQPYEKGKKPDSAVITALFSAMHNDRAAPVRMAAVSSLQALRVPELADQKARFEKELELMAKSDPELSLRIQAHLVLYTHKTKITPKTRRAAIAALLQSHETAVRLQAAQALGRIGADALDQVPALTVCIDDKDGGVGATAIHSIANIGRKDSDTKQALGALILKHAKPGIRLEVLKAVGGLGADAADLIPTLLKAKQDKDQHISLAALYGLASVGRKDKATKKLLGDWILTDAKPEDRLEEIKAVASVGEDAADLIPTLLKAASKDKEAEIQVAAVAAIPHMGNPALQAIPALQQLAADARQPEAVRDAARQTAEQLANFKARNKDIPKKGPAK